MKKSASVFTLFMSLITFVSAQGSISSGLSGGMQNLVIIIENTFRPFFAALLGDNGFLFERVLFLLVVFSMVFVVIRRIGPFQDNRAVIWIVTITVSLLSTRYLLDTGIVQSMLVPYSVLGIALTSALPLIIYFMFVQSFSDSAIIRKVLWVFFMVVFFGIWASRKADLGDFAWIYLMTAIAALVFLLIDGTIRRVIISQQQQAWDADNKEEHLSKLRRELDNIRRNRNHYSSERAYERAQRRIRKTIEDVQKS